MKIHILGGHGGLAKNFAMTSFLIDGKLLIDAGAVASSLTVKEQAQIQHILISHCHLDHIKDLAFICDNCFGLKKTAFEVYTHKTVKKIIKDHLLNDIVWPDFTKLPNLQNPTMAIFDVPEEKEFSLGEYRVIPVKVNHALDAMGFIISKEDSSVLFTLDTGPTERIWQLAADIKNLKAIFTEVSFPNSYLDVATVSCHMTANLLKKEIEKMPSGVPIILTHLKPSFHEEIVKEVQNLGNDRIRILKNDGEEFNF